MEKKIRIFLFFLFLALILRLFIFYFDKTGYKDGDFLNFQTTISNQPKVYSSYQTFAVNAPNGETIFVKTRDDISYQYGDAVAISGNLRPKLLRNYSILTMDYPEISLVSTSKLAVINFIRQKVSDTFSQVLSMDDSALILGIVFGIKENMSKSLLDRLKTSGVMHVIAASGMNVTLTAGFIFYLLSFLLKRQIAIFATIVGIFFYAALAGFQASIIRASIMAILAFSSQSLGKQSYSFYTLILTGFVMLFISPRFLLDIGFQLSFLSTAGILFIPKLFSHKENIISSDFFTTISAQIATFPIILTNFGSYSIWSILVNVLILWTVPFLMILGGVAAIFSFIFEPFARVILYLSVPLLWFFEETTRFFTNFGGVITLEKIPWQFGFSYYLFLLAIILFVKKRRQKEEK